MAHFLATLDSPASAAATFAYLADFAHCAAWDPTVAAARRIGRGAIGEGSRFEVVLAAGPIELPFTYRVTRYEPPRRLVLEAAGQGTEDDFGHLQLRRTHAFVEVRTEVGQAAIAAAERGLEREEKPVAIEPARTRG